MKYQDRLETKSKSSSSMMAFFPNVSSISFMSIWYNFKHTLSIRGITFLPRIVNLVAFPHGFHGSIDSLEVLASEPNPPEPALSVTGIELSFAISFLDAHLILLSALQGCSRGSGRFQALSMAVIYKLDIHRIHCLASSASPSTFQSPRWT